MQTDDWKFWRLEHAGLTWRAALPEDAGAIADLVDIYEARYGTDEDAPDLFAAPVILTLVAENPTGKIIDAVYIELVADITKLTTNRAGYAAFPLLLPYVGSFLQHRHIRLAQTSVVQRRAPAMAHSLKEMGFSRVDPDLTHWVRKVRD